MARVRVTYEVWVDFRAAAGWQPINVYLGELVRREVERHRSRRLRTAKLADAELVDALERARELQGELAAIVEQLERRLDRTGSGASDLNRSSQRWADEIGDADERCRCSVRDAFFGTHSGHISPDSRVADQSKSPIYSDFLVAEEGLEPPTRGL
jgi:hypothetical protein